MAFVGCLGILAPIGGRADAPPAPVLDDHLLVTWYGNPHTARMGVLGEATGPARAAALRRQAEAYTSLTPKTVLMAYQVVATVAQCAAGADGMYRRRESASVIRTLLDEARAFGFKLVLDVQVGRSTVAAELAALRPFLEEPDVYLALDPEFDVTDCQVPGQTIGRMPASEVNVALDVLERLTAEKHLPRKVLIVHQFRWDMLPDKTKIRKSLSVDVVLNMDGFGAQSLKYSSYRDVMRQGMLAFAGIKLFYKQDTKLFTPAQVMALKPQPAVVIYQ
jgi:hypothetical protein